MRSFKGTRFGYFLVGMTLLLAASSALADVTVNSVTTRQRQPWSTLVDISYSVSDSDPNKDLYICVYAIEYDYNNIIPMRTLSGEGVEAFTVVEEGETLYRVGPVKPGDHVLTWDAGHDEPEFFTKQFKVRMEAYSHDALYMIIDVSGGPEATTYPVSYMSALPEPIPDDYRTTKIALRYIPAGAFTIGSPPDELGRSSYETRCDIALTEGFYLGVFEITQQQWELVMGSNPSGYTSYGEVRPVENTSYSDIRGGVEGAGWPEHNRVDPGSFMGKLRIKTGLGFDLPLDAQWEYACRAGTTTALNSGKNLTTVDSSCPNMDKVGRYYYNRFNFNYFQREDVSGAIVLDDTNETRETARQITLDELVAGDTTNTSSGQAWFIFTPETSGWYEMSTCGLSYDHSTYLDLYAGSSTNAMTPEGTGSVDNGSIILDYLTKNVDYYVKYHSYKGPYVFSIMDFNGPVPFGAHSTVGKYLPNAWGLYDMHGNVSEHCLDRHLNNYYVNLQRPREDPVGPDAEAAHNFNLRSEGWSYTGYWFRSACRNSQRNDYKNTYTGFRLSLPINRSQ